MSLDTRKLGLILARLASDHDGEALNAARFACRMLAGAGLRPEQLTIGGSSSSSSADLHLSRLVQGLRVENSILARELQAAKLALRQARQEARERPRPSARDDFDDEPPPAAEGGGRWAQLAQEVLDAGIYLTAWERDFLGGIKRWSGELSPKQQAVWDRLQIRLRRHQADMAGGGG